MMFLADVAIRSSILLALGFAVLGLLRRAPAALRHCLLAVAVLSAAIVIPLGRVLPAWSPAPIEAIASLPELVLETRSPAPSSATRSVAGAHRSARAVPSLPAMLWLAGFLLSAGVLGIRIVRLSRSSARAARLTDDRWHAALERMSAAYGLRRAVRLARTDDPDLIAAWGVFRPCVLLPAGAGSWDDDRIHAVLCHELAHIRRHDWIVQIGAELARCLYWFNPLMALACRRLRRESEHACDDEVLRAGVRAPDYASHLLALATACHSGRATVSAGVPMARASSLERRIAVMLTAGLDRRALSRRGAVITTVLFLAAAAPIGALRGSQTSPLPLAGVIYDPSGAVLPGVSVSLVDAQEFKWEATTDAAGRFEFPPVQAGRYVLEAQLRGFRTLRTEFQLAAAGDWSRAITMPVGELSEEVTVSASRTAPSQPRGPVPVRVGGNIKAPLKLVHVSPVYPSSMREAGLSGVVPIEAIIGVDGNVLSARVRGAHVHPDFAASALDAVRQWVFSPTLLNGRPVEVVMTVSVKFELAQ